MELRDSEVLILGGSGLVGLAVARRFLEYRPGRLVITGLTREEVEEAAASLAGEPGARETTIETAWGDIFVPTSLKDRPRPEVLDERDSRELLIDDLYGDLDEEIFRRSTLAALLLEKRPEVVVDCVNTAGALAYQNVFASANDLRRKAEEGHVDPESVERHLATLYLPQLIRHTQILLHAMRRVETEIYVKIGTSGTGGMGLNIPFTHSEERPSRMLLAKSGLAGAQTLLLYLMARTPDAPAVKEIKPTAAISWKSIGYGPIRHGRRRVRRSDAVEPLPVDEAFGDGAERGYEDLDEPLEGVYLDAGENGLFTLGEFEALTALGLMEYITPEEIAEDVIREIQGHPSGHDVVSALDASTSGPSYRAGVLRSVVMERMEGLEESRGIRSVAYEMLGPPRLSKLLFEGEILHRIYGDVRKAAELDPGETAAKARELVHSDADFRQRIVSIGLPILLPDGESVLRGAEVKVSPQPGRDPVEPGVVDNGWIDLREANWERWRGWLTRILEEIEHRPGVEGGSRADADLERWRYQVRPGRLAAWVFRYEDEGERVKR